jgi:ATP-dependent Clp protease adaptor protein ClpS
LSQDRGESGIAIQDQVKVQPPSLYRVLLINDDFTPMDFVVEVLESFFAKTHAEATQIMLDVHRQGRGLCGIYPKDIAEAKTTQVIDHARAHEFPLACTYERED